jgi:hypothetical protein
MAEFSNNAGGGGGRGEGQYEFVICTTFHCFYWQEPDFNKDLFPNSRERVMYICANWIGTGMDLCYDMKMIR